MVTVNKWMLNAASTPIFFVFCQLAIAVLLLLGCHGVGLLALPKFNPATARKLWPLVLCTTLSLVFNNLCLQYVDSSFYQIARGLVLPMTVAIAWYYDQGRPSRTALICCAAITWGFGLGVFLDPAQNSKLRSTSMYVVNLVLLRRSADALQRWRCVRSPVLCDICHPHHCHQDVPRTYR